MERPERLLLLKKKRFGSGLNIEALFMHAGRPIILNARLRDAEREFKARILATNEEDADLFDPEELFDACWSRGCLEPEQKKMTKEIRDLQDQCIVPSDYNDLD